MRYPLFDLYALAHELREAGYPTYAAQLERNAQDCDAVLDGAVKLH